ncbi:MAG: Hpt domain-containing protein [Alphaproteobacteria bacterium]|nr:Hpt domain-containing protein [Alphaproteobacteria bacterium]
MTPENDNALAPDVFIDPPSDSLKKKAPPIARSLEEALKKTQDVVALAGKDYPQRLARDLDRLRELSVQFTAVPSAETMEELRFLAHDMKGQGGQFGYGLVTEICDYLQKFLKDTPAPSMRTAEIVTVHVNALILVEGKKMMGDGGKAGDVLIDSLAKLVK